MRFSITMVAVLLNATTALAVCVDFDGGGRCIETGPAPSVPMPTGIERVGPAHQGRGTQDRQEEQSAEQPRQPKKPSGPTMKSVVTGTIIEGVAEGLFRAPKPKKSVTSVTSPGAVMLERQLDEQDESDFLRAKNDLAGGLKGVDSASAQGNTIELKAPPAATGFFGTPVGLLSPDDFRKAVMNPTLTQEERERLYLRTKVAPTRLDDHPMIDSRAFVEKERYSDAYLDIASAGAKAAGTTVGLSLVDEAGKRVLKMRNIEAGYDEVLTFGKYGVERPQTTAARVMALGDYALTKAPTWAIAVDGAVNAGGAMTRQAVVRVWATADSKLNYDPRPIATAKGKWNGWYGDQGEWTRAALDRVGAGEFR